jgi:hypothetical protein
MSGEKESKASGKGGTPKAEVLQTSGLELLTQVVAIMTPLGLIGAVISDFSFWMIVAPNFFNIMSFSDHIASALLGLPISAIALCLTLISLGWLEYSLPGWLERPVGKATRKKVDFSPAIFFGSCVVLAAIAFFIQSSLKVFVVSFAVLMAVGSAIPGLRRRYRSRILARAFLFLSGMLICSTMIGAFQGVAARYGQHTTSQTINLNSGDVIARAVELRAFSQGLFFIDLSTMQTRLIPWSEIKEISSILSPKPR